MNILAHLFLFTGHGFSGRSHVGHVPAALWVVMLLGAGFIAVLLMSALFTLLARQK